MKRGIILLIIVCLMFLAILTYTIHQKDTPFSETLAIDPDKITKIQLIIPGQTHYKSTTDSEKIRQFTTYFNHLSYYRLDNSAASLMPMHASTIYLFQHKKIDFIVPFTTNVMISKKVYKVKGGTIDQVFIDQFYHTLQYTLP